MQSSKCANLKGNFVFRQIVLSGTYYMENLQTQILTGNADKAAPV